MPEEVISVEVVKSRRDFNDFLRLPRKLHPIESPWVQPLLGEQKKLLDPTRNPALKKLELVLLLARRNQRPAGRISVARVRSGGRETAGRFGFFECANDPELARALVQKAEQWLLRRGIDEMVGPFCPTIHDECGVLVEGFSTPPTLLTPYNPPYYRPLLEALGFEKAHDLYGYSLNHDTPLPPSVERIAERLRRRGDIEFRSVNMKKFDEECALLLELYNAAWSDNWGFEPMTEEEFMAHAQGLRQIVVPELLLIASVAGVPAGFSLTLPDLNYGLRFLRGRLFPFGIVTLLRKMKSNRRVRVTALGLLPRFRKRGLDALFYLETHRRGIGLGYTEGEFSWVLEDNPEMNGAAISLGAERAKTWRIYRKKAGPAEGAGPA